MRVLLLAFAKLVEGGDGGAITTYLSIAFELFTNSIERHGLPNNYLMPAGGGGSEVDSTIGKMCAQALLHFMKTSQASFKEVMVMPSLISKKSTIENAVRGEMSGYSGGGGGGGVAPAKKKLSLASFGK